MTSTSLITEHGESANPSTGQGKHSATRTIQGRSILLLVLTLVFLSLPQVPADTQQEKNDPALDLFYSANALFNRDLYESAAQEYEKFLSKYGEHEKAASAKYGLSLSYYSTGNYEKAMPFLSELSKKKGFEHRAHVQNLRGYALMSLGNHEKAVKSFNWTLNNSNNNQRSRDARTGLIEAYYRLNNWEKVIELAGPTIDQKEDGQHMSRIMFQFASAHFELQQYEKAIQALENHLSRFDESDFRHHASFLLGECRRITGKLDGALELYNRVVDELKGPYSPEARYRIGLVQFRQEKYDPAITSLETYLDKHKDGPSAPNARFYLARANLEKENFDRSISILKKLQNSDTIAGQAVLWLARAHARRDEHGKAEKVLSKNLDRFRNKDQEEKKQHPLLGDLLFEHGQALMNQGKFEDAAGQFRASIEAKPEGSLAPGALYLQAYCLHQNENYDRAGTLCETYLEKYEEHENRGDVLFLLGETQFLKNAPDEALQTMGRFVKNFNDHDKVPVAKLRIGQLHYRNEQWEKALGRLEPFVESSPDDPVFDQVGFLVGDSYFQLEQWEKAINTLKEFTNKHGDAAQADLAHLRLALAYRRTGNMDSARNVLQQLINNYSDSDLLAEARVELGRIFYENESYEQARKTLENISNLQEQPRGLYYRGWVARQTENYQDATNYFKQLSDHHADHELVADALLQRGIILVEQNQAYDKGRMILSQITDNHPNFEKTDRVQFYLGLILARQENWEEAAGRFRTVINDYDRSPVADRALYELAWCEKEMDRPDEASKQYRTLLDQYPDSDRADDAALELAELNYESEKYDTAIEQLKELLNTSDDQSINQRARYRLGWCYRKKEDFSGAANWFEKVLGNSEDASPLVVRAAYQAGEAWLEKKEFKPAYEHFSRARKDLENNDYDLRDVFEKVLLRNAETAAQTDRWSESFKLHRRFLDTFSDSELTVRARFGVGWALENKEKYDEAIKAYKKVTSSDQRGPTAARCQFQIGECHFAADRPQKAIRALIKVTTEYGHDRWSAQALLEIGRILQDRGDNEKAADRFREVIEKYEDSDASDVAKERLSELSEGE